MFKHYPVLMFLAVGAMQCAQASFSCISSRESRAVTHFNFMPMRELPSGRLEYYLSDEDIAYVDLACSDCEGALQARDEILKQDHERCKIIFKYLVWKSQLPKYAHSIRAWAACLALCIADVSFVKKAELEKLLKVRDFEKLPEAWKKRARQAYQRVVARCTKSVKELK